MFFFCMSGAVSHLCFILTAQWMKRKNRTIRHVGNRRRTTANKQVDIQASVHMALLCFTYMFLVVCEH